MGWRRWLVLAATLAAFAPRPTLAQYDPARLPDASRRWSVDVGVRGEYDDNIFTAPNNETTSFKSSISPRFLLNIPTEQTFIGFRYAYGATWFENRARDNFDQTHAVDLLLAHTFNPRLTLNLSDRFRFGVEPDIVEIQTGQPVVLSRRGDYFNNLLDGSLAYQLSRRWQLRASGRWIWWDYDTAAASSNDRDDYQGTISTIFVVDPRSSVGLNYRYGRIDYNQAGVNDERNSDSHFVFLSGSRRFSPQFSGRIDGGGEYRQFDDGVDQFSPYVDSSLSYAYAPGSAATGGFRYSISTTEQAGFRSTDTASIFGQLTHRFTPKLSGSFDAVYSFSSFENPTGPVIGNSLEEQSLFLGLSARYQFTRWFSAEAGYNYTEKFSDIPGNEFNRNRVYLGGRFVY